MGIFQTSSGGKLVFAVWRWKKKKAFHFFSHLDDDNHWEISRVFFLVFQSLDGGWQG